MSGLQILRAIDPISFAHPYPRLVQVHMQPIMLDSPTQVLIETGRALFHRGHWYGSGSITYPYVRLVMLGKQEC